MLLPDHEIDLLVQAGQIGITPYHPECLNPASVDLTLHPVVRSPKSSTPQQWGEGGIFPEIDVADVPVGYTEPFTMHEEFGYRLHPGQFILASTNEVVHIPDDLTARVEGKSSIGRLGLAIHVTAGYIDPGFKGQVTLEIANFAPWPIRLRSSMRIAQIAFTRMSSPAAVPYNQTGHYADQVGPTESRFRYRVPGLSPLVTG